MTGIARDDDQQLIPPRLVTDASGSRLAPAILIASFDREGVIDWQALGQPRLDGAPTARGTIFRIASMSKSFLSAAALALAEEGLLDLDLGIDEYVPGVHFRLHHTEYRVTVRELLGNRSGMPEDNAWGDRMLVASRDEIGQLASDGFALTSIPGEKYQYSNLGMSLVGRALEAVSGAPVEDLVRSRFLDPLGLSHTRYEVSDYPANTDLAAGFRSFDGGRSWDLEPYVGSGALACIGGLFSTIDDVTKWAIFLASAFHESPLHPEILSARARREMQRADTPIPIKLDDPECQIDALGYGMGLVAAHDRRFGWVSQHSGGLPGFSSHMRWHPSSGLGVVAFGNSDFFCAETLAANTLTRLLDARNVSDSLPPWPATVSAGESLDALLQSGTPLAEAGASISTNLLLDVPDEIRRRRFDDLKLTAKVHRSQRPFLERIDSSEDPAHLKWSICGEQDSLVCEIRLVGLEPALVQSLTVTLASNERRAKNGHVRAEETS